MTRQTLSIARAEMVRTRLPTRLYLVQRLVAAGAPLRIRRTNPWDVSELEPEEIERYGALTVWRDDAADAMVYTWGAEGDDGDQ